MFRLQHKLQEKSLARRVLVNYVERIHSMITELQDDPEMRQQPEVKGRNENEDTAVSPTILIDYMQTESMSRAGQY